MHKLKLILSLLIIAIVFSSCNLFNITRQKIVKPVIKRFTINKKDTLEISSLSVLTRFSLNKNNDWKIFDRAKVLDYENYFEDIKSGIFKLNKSINYKIKFKADIVTNDSIFKPLLLNNNFTKGFTYDQISKIDFSNKKDGLYVNVTVIKEDNGSSPGWGGPHSYHLNLVYDFCVVKNGLLQAHSVFLRHRNLNVFDIPKKHWKPLPRDTRRVFKKLYKQKE